MIFNYYLVNSRECTFSKFMDNTKLGGTFNMLQGCLQKVANEARGTDRNMMKWYRKVTL